MNKERCRIIHTVLRDTALFSDQRHTDVNCHLHTNLPAEIVLISEGELQMTVNQETFLVHAGEGIFVLPFESHSFNTPEHSRCHVLMFTPDVGGANFDFLRCTVPKTRVFTVPEPIRETVNYFLPETSGHRDALRAQAVVIPLLTLITEQCSFSAEQPLSGEEPFLRILRAIDRDFFNEDLTLTSLAESIGMHPMSVSRAFSRKAGVSFQEYLGYRRASYAASLLTNTESSITEIAYLSGFGSLRNFNRVFRRHFEKTPTEYKAEREKEKMTDSDGL